jgi:hypothetical protein
MRVIVIIHIVNTTTLECASQSHVIRTVQATPPGACMPLPKYQKAKQEKQ